MADREKIVIGEVRFSYVHVFEPTQVSEDGAKKYNISIIIPKSNKKAIEKVSAAVQKAFNDSLGFFNGKLPKVWNNPLRDGDTEKDDPAYEGCMFLTANSKFKPGVVDANLEPIIDPEEFYSGCYGRVSLNFFPYNVNGNKGIGVGLCNLQKLRDGEHLGGTGTSAEDDFRECDEEDLM